MNKYYICQPNFPLNYLFYANHCIISINGFYSIEYIEYKGNSFCHCMQKSYLLFFKLLNFIIKTYVSFINDCITLIVHNLLRSNNISNDKC